MDAHSQTEGQTFDSYFKIPNSCSSVKDLVCENWCSYNTFFFTFLTVWLFLTQIPIILKITIVCFSTRRWKITYAHLRLHTFEKHIHHVKIFRIFLVKSSAVFQNGTNVKVLKRFAFYVARGKFTSGDLLKSILRRIRVEEVQRLCRCKSFMGGTPLRWNAPATLCRWGTF